MKVVNEGTGAADTAPGRDATRESEPPSRSAPGTAGATLLAVSGWRLLIAVFGLIGWGDAASRLGFLSSLEDLSHLASFTVGLVFLWLAVRPFTRSDRAPEPPSAWVRGAATVALLLVAVVWHTLMGGLEDGYTTTSSLFAHLLTPLVVLADWLLVGRGQGRARWWYPLSWTLPLLAYLGFMVGAGVESYHDFLNPDEEGFLATVAAFTIAVVVTGYVLVALGRVRAAVVGGAPVADGAPAPGSAPEPAPLTPPTPAGGAAGPADTQPDPSPRPPVTPAA
ncbi:hypothetical protein [Streptomyces sp. ST2-7A]|uniref:hypothetical protein n=1 Tax=Streptomyces sp. ST2-7A TaxID=2907214 RepID=UPI001F1E1BD6|nr:hypothetical protein [Streptomyces sp. ST2-7A]MCE7080288.1 hypothetical protein [Streptomyces sp. ST2-7A]